jgi:hypothetical protein
MVLKKTKKETKRKTVLDIKNCTVKTSVNEKSQIELLNKLYLEEEYNGKKFMKWITYTKYITFK